MRPGSQSAESPPAAPAATAIAKQASEDVDLGYVDPIAVGSIGALIIGVLFIFGGLHARRHGRLRTRQGAEVLAGFAAVVGLAAMAAGALSLLSHG